jgi:hypothetical protein
MFAEICRYRDYRVKITGQGRYSPTYLTHKRRLPKGSENPRYFDR